MIHAEKQHVKVNKKNSGNIALRIASVLFCLVMITTWMTGGLLAKFISTDSGDDSARVAAFVFRVQEQLASFEIPVTEYIPGDTVQEYAFTVTNETESGLICETDQEYSIKMKLDGSLPIVCTLVKELGSGQQAASRENVGEIDALTAPKLPAETSCTGSFEAGVAGNDTYIVKIEWPKEADRMQPDFAGGVAEVEIQITSVQTD